MIVHLSIISSQLLTERYLPSLKLKLNFSPLYPSLSLSLFLKKNPGNIFYFIQIFFFPKKKKKLDLGQKTLNSRIFFKRDARKWIYFCSSFLNICKYIAAIFKLKIIFEKWRKNLGLFLQFFIQRVSISIVARCVNGREVFARASTAVILYLYARKKKFRLMGENEREYWTRIHSWIHIYIYIFRMKLFLLLSPPPSLQKFVFHALERSTV